MTRETNAKTPAKNAPTAVMLPAELLLGAEMCTSHEEARYYLNGVFLQAKDKTTLRILGTDGHVLFVAEQKVAEPQMPFWAKDGVIVSNEHLKSMIKMVGKLNGDGLIRLDVPRDGGRCTLGDGLTVDFHPRLVDGTFPDVDHVIGSAETALSGRERQPGDEDGGFSSKLMRRATDVAKAVNPEIPASSGVRIGLYIGTKEQPAVVTLSRGGCYLILMPMRGEYPADADTLNALAPAVKRTIAALKAHRTRVTEALPNLTGEAKDEAKAKKADIDRRIAYFSTGKAPAIEDKSKPAAETPKAETAPEAPRADIAAAEKAEAAKPAESEAKPKAETKAKAPAKAATKAKTPETVH